MNLSLRLGTKSDLRWAQATVAAHHYLHQRVNNLARPMTYVVELSGRRLGLVMVSNPHAPMNGGWYGYPGQITQWQVVDLCRIWFDPAIQLGGELARPGLVPGFTDRKGIFRPTVASWAIPQVLARVQADRVSLYPPVYPAEPYHIRLVISYCDPAYHKGLIYRLTGARPMYTDEQGQPKLGPNGKYGWCWPLPEPEWAWFQIPIRRPRTMRLPVIG